jgi:hypothetical protein
MAVRRILSSSDPASTDDAYDVGSFWVNTTTLVSYVCLSNATDAAVWVQFAARDLTIPAGTPNAADDEFSDRTDESGPVNELAAKWDLLQNLGTPGWFDFSAITGNLRLAIPAGQAETQGFFQDLPSGDWLAIMAYKPIVWSGRMMYGIEVVDGSGNGNAVFFDHGDGSNGGLRVVASYGQTGSFAGFSTASSGHGGVINEFSGLALRKTGSTLYAGWTTDVTAIDPDLWAGIGSTSQAISGTPTKIGICRGYGNGQQTTDIEFFRVFDET